MIVTVSFYNCLMLKPTDLIHDCLLPTPRDLETARFLGWYCFPLHTAPEVVAVDYLAFYQPSIFSKGGGWTELVAQVRGHELTTRRELLKNETNHPHVREEYYKIQIRALEKLKEPVRSDKWKRLTFLYTTGDYLLKAEPLSDLEVDGDERQLLWRSLCELTENKTMYKTALPEADVSTEALTARLGTKEQPASYDPLLFG